jgi:hypothetical protein
MAQSMPIIKRWSHQWFTNKTNSTIPGLSIRAIVIAPQYAPMVRLEECPMPFPSNARKVRNTLRNVYLFVQYDLN